MGLPLLLGVNPAPPAPLCKLGNPAACPNPPALPAPCAPSDPPASLLPLLSPVPIYAPPAPLADFAPCSLCSPCTTCFHCSLSSITPPTLPSPYLCSPCSLLCDTCSLCSPHKIFQGTVFGQKVPIFWPVWHIYHFTQRDSIFQS